MSLRITTQTVEYVFVPVTVDGSAPDSGLTVEVAMPAEGAAPATWVTAEWDAGRARVLVAGDDVKGDTASEDFALAAGRYDVWVKVTSTPEIPARKAGVLIVS